MNAEQIREIIREELAAFFASAPPRLADPPLNSIEAIQRKALELARQGRRAESIELQKSIGRMVA